jgi:hypothetical protein
MDDNNIQLLCPEHAPKPMKESPDLTGKEGWFVKIPLKVRHTSGVEHVWLKVVWSDSESVEGTLHSHPVHADELFGDTIIAPRDQIEEVYPPEPETPHAS